MRLEVDEMPTIMELTMEYIHTLQYKELFRGILATTVCLAGTIGLLLLIKCGRTCKGLEQPPNTEQWHKDNGMLKRKVVENQSKMMSQPNVKETTAYVNCMN